MKKKIWSMRAYLAVLASALSVLTGSMWFIDKTAFAVTLPVSLIIVVFFYARFTVNRQQIYRTIVSTSALLDGSQQEFLKGYPLSILITTDKREIVWYSDPFRELVMEEGRDIYGENLDIFDTAPIEDFCLRGGKQLTFAGKTYRVTAVRTDSYDARFFTFYFFDITKLYRDAEAYRLTRPSVAILAVDNYAEVTQQAKESEKSRILGQIDALIEEFTAGDTTSFVRRYDVDKYLVVIEEQHLEKIIASRFPILDKAREIISSENVPVTISIGVGRGEDTLYKSEASARNALDMALGRGGDQAAVRTGIGYEFFGGVSKGVEKRTKVKSRIVATAMKELIMNADRVLVMGHRFGDLDCVGAATGLAYACRTMGRQAEVVIDRNTNLAEDLVEMVAVDGNHSLYIDPDEAIFRITEKTLLVITDTHTKNLLESQKVYEKCKTVVVIDHHRKMVDHIDNTTIFYHEPYASSASELVTELIQYLGDNCRISAVVAQALLSGIMLDTKNFALKTGVRTFEAAAYLRRAGADTIGVKKLFSSTIDSYRAKSAVVAAAEIYGNCAISVCENGVENIRVVSSQAADELLNIDGVAASFVLYGAGDTVSISARSMGEVNVQIVMENLGGGGHQTMAAAQLKGVSQTGAMEQLTAAIDRYFEERKPKKLLKE